MAISPEERRFLRHWEDQRRDGRRSFMVTYTIGLFIMVFMIGVALALFSGLPFIRIYVIGPWVLLSLCTAVALALRLWRRQERRFVSIIRREMATSPDPKSEDATPE